MRYKELVLKHLEASEQLTANILHGIQTQSVSPQQALQLLQQLTQKQEQMRALLEIEHEE